MVHKFPHEWEDLSVVGGGSHYKLAIFEGGSHCLRHIASGKVKDLCLHILLFQLFYEIVHSLPCVAIDRSVCNCDSILFWSVARPLVVKGDVVAKVFLQYRTMERKDHGDIQSSSLLQEALDHLSIFSHDTDVVSSCLVIPSLLHIKSPELTEAISCEQGLLCLIIGHYDFRPMDHWSSYESESMASYSKSVPFLHHYSSLAPVYAKEILHHLEGLHA